jgi:hypothetical protein
VRASLPRGELRIVCCRAWFCKDSKWRVIKLGWSWFREILDAAGAQLIAVGPLCLRDWRRGREEAFFGTPISPLPQAQRNMQRGIQCFPPAGNHLGLHIGKAESSGPPQTSCIVTSEDGATFTSGELKPHC